MLKLSNQFPIMLINCIQGFELLRIIDKKDCIWTFGPLGLMRLSVSAWCAFLTFVLVDIVCPVDVQGGVRVHRDANIPDVSVDLSRFVPEIATTG